MLAASSFRKRLSSTFHLLLMRAVADVLWNWCTMILRRRFWIKRAVPSQLGFVEEFRRAVTFGNAPSRRPGRSTTPEGLSENRYRSSAKINSSPAAKNSRKE